MKHPWMCGVNDCFKPAFRSNTTCMAHTAYEVLAMILVAAALGLVFASLAGA